MDDPLRDRHSVLEMARRKQVIEIANEIGSFERLAEAIEADLSALDASEVPPDWRQTPVRGQVRFGFAATADGVPVLHGELSTRATVQCQRCLKAFEMTLETEMVYRLTWPGADQEGSQDLEGLEQWELADERLRPIEIADEALVMALPLSARHDDDTECVTVMADDERSEMTTPFASLRAQMDETE